jgi:hypothetical protein
MLNSSRILPTAAGAILLLSASFGSPDFLSTGSAVASEAELTDLVIDSTQSDLVLSARISGGFSKEFKEAVIKGIPFTIVFFIDLYKVREFWFDKKIVQKTETGTIRYNDFTREYSVSRSWAEESPVIVPTVDRAAQLISEVDRLEVIPLSMLKKNRKYQIRAKARCQVHRNLLFRPPWCFETDWYTVDFNY